MQLVLDSRGLTLKKRNGCFQVIQDEKQRIINPKRLDSIAVTKDCLLSSNAIKLAVKEGVPIFFMDEYGNACGRIWSARFKKIGTIRRRQIQLAEIPLGTVWVLEFLQYKTAHQIANLRYLHNRKLAQQPQIEQSIERMNRYWQQAQTYEGKLLEECRDQIMGLEGVTSRTYWQSIAKCLPDEYGFEGRKYRPCPDKFNAALNYCYGMLYALVEGAVLTAGFDQQCGLLHRDSYNKPTFVYDAIEAFRPWIDRLLLEYCLSEKLDFQKHFEQRDDTYSLNKAGKHLMILRFNAFQYERKQFNGLRLRTKHHLYQYMGRLANSLRELNDTDFLCPVSSSATT